MRYWIAPALATASLLLGACGSSQPDAPPPKPQGREETRGIRATDAIGYSGSAIADKVDGALNAKFSTLSSDSGGGAISSRRRLFV